MIYKSRYKISLKDYVKKELSEIEQNIFWLLFSGFGIEQKLQSSYFELFRVGDGKYTLTVQKYVDNTWSVKFIINKNFKNKLQRFTN